jgi:hypothetical protein
MLSFPQDLNFVVDVFKSFSNGEENKPSETDIFDARCVVEVACEQEEAAKPKRSQRSYFCS